MFVKLEDLPIPTVPETWGLNGAGGVVDWVGVGFAWVVVLDVGEDEAVVFDEEVDVVVVGDDAEVAGDDAEVVGAGEGVGDDADVVGAGEGVGEAEGVGEGVGDGVGGVGAPE